MKIISTKCMILKTCIKGTLLSCKSSNIYIIYQWLKSTFPIMGKLREMLYVAKTNSRQIHEFGIAIFFKENDARCDNQFAGITRSGSFIYQKETMSSSSY
jgi:hypothetical protein